MSNDNPYASPVDIANQSAEAPRFARVFDDFGVTSGSVGVRHFSAIVDNAIAAILSVVIAKCLNEDWPGIQTIVMVLVYLGYYVVQEWLFGRTFVKMIAGLTMIRRDGRQPGLREALIRTGMRLLEVNPFLLGALPAALSIIFSRRRQRFGDKLAGTLIVRTDVLTALAARNAKD